MRGPMAGFFTPERKLFGIVLCAFLAGPFSLSAKAQAIQAQTGSSESQAQAQQDQKKQEKNKKEKKHAKQAQTAESHQKQIKVKVVHEDKKKTTAAQPTGPSVAPDKVLYQRAVVDIKKGRYTEGRLALQTLINTYPDSEYLAKAKLATADSYYKEGGISGLTQAVEEYKNFIIFFPFLDEAAYAQMQVGMAHFRMMEKPDRDTSQALEAEQEFQTFLLKYPKSPLVPQAEQHLRDVQEVIADGEFRVARFYYMRPDYPAAAARLMDLVERYPLYSQTDQALWMLANVYERAKHASKNEDDKNHWADLAGECYTRILTNYPLSSLSGQAKSRLTGMGMKLPPADPQAMARMKHEQMYDNDHHGAPAFAFLKSPMALLKSSPSVAEAAHFGMPTLSEPNDVISARDVLKQDAAGPNFELANQQLSAPLQAPPPSQDDATPVDANTGSSGDVPQGTGVGAEIITPTTGSDVPAQAASSGSEQPAANTESAPAPAANAPSGLSSINGTEITTATPSTNAQPAPTARTAAAPVSGVSQPQPAAQPTSAAAANAQTSQDPSAQNKTNKKYKTPKMDNSTESSSKKKKGLKKIIPW